MRTGRKRILALLLSLLLFPGWSADVQAEEAEPTASEAQDAEPLIVEEELNRWMEDYLSQISLNPDWQRFSVGFYYSGTGESWYYDADQWMYSASLYKVPVSMLMAEKEAAGEVTQDSWIATQYASGTLQYLESSALTWSNNDSGHALVEYLGGTYAGKCADQTVRFTELPDDYFAEDFFQMSYYSARYMTQVMATLLAGGEERFPHVIEYLLPAQPDGSAADSGAETMSAGIRMYGNRVEIAAAQGRLPRLQQGKAVDQIRRAEDPAVTLGHTAAAHPGQMRKKSVDKFRRVAKDPAPKLPELFCVLRCGLAQYGAMKIPQHLSHSSVPDISSAGTPACRRASTCAEIPDPCRPPG